MDIKSRTFYPPLCTTLCLGNLEEPGLSLRRFAIFFRRAPDGMPVEKRTNVEISVSSLLNFQVADPRDAIYALLLLAKDSSLVVLGAESLDLVGSVDTRIVPNYHKEVSDIWIGFVEYCVVTSNSLNLICRHWAPTLGGSELLLS